MLLSLELLAAAPVAPAAPTRLKDIVSIEGVRDNQLIGYGLVVGLNGTGDKRQTVFSAQALTNVLQRMGVSVNPSAILVRNMAAVMVTATLPPFGQPGTRIDVTAAAVGDASNLQGGLLLLTPLKGPDGKVYAAAQGSILTGGFVAGRGGNSQSLNHPTVGRVPGGAIVEAAPPSIAPSSKLVLQLQQADFTTAARVSGAINQRFPGDPVAHALNSAAVSVDIPASYANRSVEFVSEIENLTILTAKRQRIVVNEKTGTIILGKDIRIAPVAILHGALSVEIRTAMEVSQPNPLSQGKTVAVSQPAVDSKEENARMVMLEQGATVEDLTRALEAIGSTARDIIAILENLKAAGALDADIDAI